MLDEEDQPLLVAPLVAIFATLVVLLFAQVLPAIRETPRGLPSGASIRTLLGQ